MRRALVVGNWKMHGSRQSVERLLSGLTQRVAAPLRADVAVCPPFVYLPQVEAALANTVWSWGAQNVCAQDEGAYTGEVSAPMLREFGCRYVIVGHSERRALYGESDALAADKLVRVLDAGMTPIFCVGETLRQREQGETEVVIARQLQAALDRAGVDALSSAVLAYEPVWAIGTGKTAAPEQAQAVHAFIRAQIAKCSPAAAANVRILYGGSVKAANAAELMAQEDIDGALVGGASLDAEEFAAICAAA